MAFCSVRNGKDAKGRQEDCVVYPGRGFDCGSGPSRTADPPKGGTRHQRETVITINQQYNAALKKANHPCRQKHGAKNTQYRSSSLLTVLGTGKASAGVPCASASITSQ